MSDDSTDTTETGEVAHASLATAVFEPDAGTWDLELEIRPRPGAEPLRHKGVATRRMLGGFLVADHETDSGFFGHGVYGWDASRQRYTGVWIDSVLTAMARMTGRYDAGERTMTWDVEVEHAGRTMRYREIRRAVDEETQHYRQLVPLPGGGEHEMIAITYRRRA